ncbi:MAG: hypothetical protein VYE22_30835 [Myxococcota bacterium]|nr:hypothetical protein [Myxococcota bacterium]
MTHGTGYNVPSSQEIYDLMYHRRRQLEALSLKAAKDDALQRELDELDRDIARGVNALDEMEETERLRIARTLKKRIDSHA